MPILPNEAHPFVFNPERDMWICLHHGEQDYAPWVPCWNGCNEGWFDEYEDDPIECELGEMSMCSECHGKGGWSVCPECNADNPDVEW